MANPTLVSGMEFKSKPSYRYVLYTVGRKNKTPTALLHRLSSLGTFTVIYMHIRPIALWSTRDTGKKLFWHSSYGLGFLHTKTYSM